MKLQLGLVLFLVACSSDKAHIGDGKGNLDSGVGGGGTGGSGGSAGGSGGSGGGSSCPSNPEAAIGQTCDEENKTCGECSNPCQFCNLIRCEAGKWSPIEAAPPPCDDAGVCPPLVVNSLPNCSPKYAGSFECYCAQGEMYHPIGCDTTRDELFDKSAQLTLAEYDCGYAVIYVPASLDGDQEYIFDPSGKLVGAHVSSDHGPACAAGADVPETCVVSNCTQKTVDSPPCPL